MYVISCSFGTFDVLCLLTLFCSKRNLKTGQIIVGSMILFSFIFLHAKTLAAHSQPWEQKKVDAGSYIMIDW